MHEYNILACQVGPESLGGTDLKTESGEIHCTLAQLKTNTSIRKCVGELKVGEKFRWNQVSLWQHRVLRETSF